MRTFFAFLFALGFAFPSYADDPVWNYSKGDSAMNAAISDARNTLPVFYDKLAKTDLTSEVVLLKVAMRYGNPENNNFEHIWVAVADRNGDQFDGFFANDPAYIDYNQGDPISFTEADISDWMFYDEKGMMNGAFTIRVMLPDLPAEQAEQYRQMLAPLPYGTGQDG